MIIITHILLIERNIITFTLSKEYTHKYNYSFILRGLVYVYQGNSYNQSYLTA